MVPKYQMSGGFSLLGFSMRSHVPTLDVSVVLAPAFICFLKVAFVSSFLGDHCASVRPPPGSIHNAAERNSPAPQIVSRNDSFDSDTETRQSVQCPPHPSPSPARPQAPEVAFVKKKKVGLIKKLDKDHLQHTLFLGSVVRGLLAGHFEGGK